VQISNLREWRERRALTQEELAERAGVSARSVAGYEAGSGARPGTVRKLAAALDIGVEELQGKAAASPSPLPAEERRIEGREQTSTETRYTPYEALGRVLASDWEAELKEWNQKLPAGKEPELFDLGRLLEWGLAIAGDKGVYEAIGRDSGYAQRAEFQDTLRLMEDAAQKAAQKLKLVFGPLIDNWKFQKIVQENNLYAIVSEGQSHLKELLQERTRT
jgi:transcriptional regulator with XRE-family HTH domain